MTRKLIILITICGLFSPVIFSQTIKITGKVMDKDFQPIPRARIYTSDTILLGETDGGGNFRCVIDSLNNELVILSVGMESKLIQPHYDCIHLEIIMFFHCSCDFMTLEEADRLRKREFKKLTKIHAKGFENGFLLTKKPCYDDIFIANSKQEVKL